MSSFAPWDDARTHLIAANLVAPDHINWPNENFDTPDPRTADAAWLAIEMTSTVLEPIELGAGAWQEDGILFVHVFVPWGTGTEFARTLAKDVANAFRGLAPAPTYYLRANFDAGSRDVDDGNWWRMSVTVEWRYQDITV